MDDGSWLAGLLLVVFLVLLFVAVGYSMGADRVAEIACIAQGFDAGSYTDGAIQCVTYGTP